MSANFVTEQYLHPSASTKKSCRSSADWHVCSPHIFDPGTAEVSQRRITNFSHFECHFECISWLWSDSEVFWSEF